jgi:hypothetical protein
MTSYDAVINPPHGLATGMKQLLPPALRRWLLRMLQWVLGVAMFVALVLGVVLFSAVQRQPMDITQATGSKAAVAQVLRQTPWLQSTLQGERTRVSLPLDGLNALFFDLMQRTVGGRGAVKVMRPASQGGVRTSATVTVLASIPSNRTSLSALPGEYWLNLHSRWEVLANGQFRLEQASVGRLPLPVALLDAVFNGILLWQDWDEFKHIALQSLQHIEAGEKQLTIEWQLDDALQSQLFAALIPPEQLDRIHAYQLVLVETLQNLPTASGRSVPLLQVLQPMFKVAQERTLGQQLNPSNVHHPEQIPVLENRALLLALTLHALEVSPSEFIPQAKQWPPALPRPFTLRGRIDFAQHYLMSALLASGVGGRLTDLVGVYKEQADKVAGSGFSFNDIAADRAGNRFGQRARLSAQALQVRVQESDQEDFFMPDVTDMPQYLSAQEFEKRFSGSNRNAYDAMIQAIDQRIHQLGVLQQ